VEVTVRWSKGRDIDAACGQLLTATGRAAKVQKESVVEALS
jgi:adenine C2-methylase RlmN of 23S rRNA A2503 and tRNA A37